MTRFLLTIFFLVPLLQTFAQTPKTFRGTVLDTAGGPIAGATITLYGADFKPTGNVATGADGTFRIQVPAGASYGYITHTGYFPFRINSLAKDSVLIYLRPETRQLAEVNIRSEKPFIEQQFDRMVVNVDGDPKTGMNVLDVLKKVPGLVIPNENSVVFENKSVSILIDGKLTRLSGRELVTLLASTPSSGVSQIEIMPTPSAKYDAQGDGGLINIKTIKRVKPGYDANVSLTGGHGWKYLSNNSAYAGLNYRWGKNYGYGSYGYGFGKQSQEIQTTTYLEGAGQRLLDSLRYKTPYRNQNVRLGWDHYLDKNEVFGALLTAYRGHYDPQTVSQTGIYRLKDFRPDSVRYADNATFRTTQGVNLNLNYKTLLDSVKKKELSMDADAGLFHYQNDNRIGLQLKSNGGSALSPVQQLSQNGETLTKIYSYKADYLQKFKKGTLETGIKGSYVTIENDFLAESGIAGSVLSDNGSNDFRYRETVLAGYVTSKQTFGKLTLQGGLRAEQTFTQGNSLTLDSVVDRHYLNLFPNLIGGYNFGSGSLNASYARRIGRPSYGYLNPFRIVRGAYSVFRGNPYLQPSFTSNYRLSYTAKSNFSFTAAYSRSENVIADLSLVDEQSKVTTALKANLNDNINGSMQVSYSGKLFGWLAASYTAGMARNSYHFDYLQSPVTVRQLTGYTYLDNQVELPADWWLDVYIYAQSRVTYGNEVNLPLTTTQLSGGKKVLKGKGSFSFSINDIFFTGVQRSRANYGNVNNETRSRYDSRNVRLSLSYNFGSAKVDVRKRNSGSAEEQRRSL
ncbi:outer membrane beta-barrel family protein [Hufsiella ginkgonis]|uniref:TonB-dependent receptor n=1 Tax=Hufsiella ginkgonis TaxID=2695274 RepID=A0A7K1XYQ6_9SPHI|nr:outer membrane beta-barrel family protein [Hufsiella ginkgonis]MXV15967.1 TonB-dependent receptor [Hufsiella ginkgonis]